MHEKEVTMDVHTKELIAIGASAAVNCELVPGNWTGG